MPKQMTPKQSIIFVIAIAITVFISIQVVYGQNETVEFKTYTNNDMKFSIQYPSNWELGQNLEDSERVWFMSPDRGIPIIIINTKKVEPYLDTDTMTLKNTSLQQSVLQELNRLPFPEMEDFNIIRQNAVTVGGNSGWKTEYKFSWQGDPIYHSKIYTIANGK